MRALVRDHSLKDAQIGVVIVDCDTGNVLAQAGEHVVVNPASNAKLYTAAAALAMLHGPTGTRRLSAARSRAAPRDPRAARPRRPVAAPAGSLWELAQELKAHGVRRVDGDIMVDQRFFDDSFTPPAFEQQPNEWAAFRAPVSALAVNENTSRCRCARRGGRPRT